jgi:DNA topoisomerase-1
LQHPRDIDMHRVDAQQARRVLDRLIGYPVSAFLGRKIRRGLSAGRVQSVAVRMVVDREREIQAFIPVEYWTLQAELARRESKATFTASLVERQGEKIDLKTGVEAQAVQSDLDGAGWQVANVREREQQRHPDAPFTTSTLQQEASRKLGYSARRTMVVAQQLYEGLDIGGGEAVGLITYMRTDSVNVAQSALEEARDYIRGKLAKEMLPAVPRTYKTRSKLAQEAHEAIRPTSVFREPDSIRAHLSPVRPGLEALSGIPDGLSGVRRDDRGCGRRGAAKAAVSVPRQRLAAQVRGLPESVPRRSGRRRAYRRRGPPTPA